MEMPGLSRSLRHKLSQSRQEWDALLSGGFPYLPDPKITNEPQ